MSFHWLHLIFLSLSPLDIQDLGILENDIVIEDDKLVDKGRKVSLDIRKNDSDNYRIGDFNYPLSGNVIDLGLFTRQPKLWLGNPQLIRFCPVREGWDVPVHPESLMIRVEQGIRYSEETVPVLKSIRDQKVIQSNALLIKALFF